MSETRGALSRDEYVRGAVEIVDELGLNALTMRALGDRLGVDATAIYRHFPSKERLVDAMLDAILGEAANTPPAGDTPRARILSVAANVRAALRAHPNVAGSLAIATGDFPSGLTLTRLLIGELRALGLSGEGLVRMYQSLEGYILGSSVFDTGGYPDTFVIRQARYRYLAEPEFDAVATSPANVERVTEDAFTETLNQLIDRCEHLAHH